MMTMDSSQLRVDDHVRYLAEHGVLICRPCKHAVEPEGGIRAHLQSKHVALPITVRRSLIEYAAGVPLKAPEDVTMPDATSSPIPELELKDGCQCDECGYVCASESNMILHCKTEHRWIKVKGQRWKERKVQTFFPSNKRRYFVVVEPGTEQDQLPTIDRLIEALLTEGVDKDKEEDEQLGMVDRDQYMVDKSPWMRRTGWLREFGGKDMATIVKKSWRPTKDEAWLQSIWKSVGRVLDTCVDGVADCTERNWKLISFWLNGSEAGKADSKPFNIDNDRTTIKRYKESWQRLICYCIRAL